MNVSINLNNSKFFGGFPLGDSIGEMTHSQINSIDTSRIFTFIDESLHCSWLKHHFPWLPSCRTNIDVENPPRILIILHLISFFPWVFHIFCLCFPTEASQISCATPPPCYMCWTSAASPSPPPPAGPAGPATGGAGWR